MRIVPPGQGEVIRDNEDSRAEVLVGSEALALVRFRFASGRSGPDHHVHHHHCDGFFVLDGKLQLDLGPDRKSFDITAGTLAVAPPYVVHTFRNASDGDVSFLNIHAPGMEFHRHLRDEDVGFDQHQPPADGGRALSEAVIGVAANFRGLAAELVGLDPAEARSLEGSTLFVLDGKLAVEGVAAGAGTCIGLEGGTVTAGGGGARMLVLRTPAT